MLELEKVNQKPLDLLKKEALDLKKSLGLENEKAQVVTCFDCSSSMSSIYRSDLAKAMMKLTVSMALNFDDNGEIPVIAFDDNVKRTPDITEKNLDGYVDKHLVAWGGTNYMPALKEAVKAMEKKQDSDPGLIIFFTDGDNWDKEETSEYIKEMSNKYPIFIQFIGIYTDSNPGFSYLKKLDNLTGRKVDNAGFSLIPLKKITQEDFMKTVLSEYAGVGGKRFSEKAKDAGLLPWNEKDDTVNGGSFLSRIFGR